MADLLGDLLADPDRDLLPHIVTLLLGFLGFWVHFSSGWLKQTRTW